MIYVNMKSIKSGIIIPKSEVRANNLKHNYIDNLYNRFSRQVLKNVYEKETSKET